MPTNSVITIASLVEQQVGQAHPMRSLINWQIGRQENSTCNVNFWASIADKQFRVNKT